MSRAQSIRDKFFAVEPNVMLQFSSESFRDGGTIRLPYTQAVAVWEPSTWTWDYYPHGIANALASFEIYSDQDLVEEFRASLRDVR